MGNRAIIDAVLNITGTQKATPVFYINATVESIDLSTRSCVCTVIDGQAEYTLSNVLLMAVVDDGILIEPVIGSTVKVIYSQNVEPFICQYSEVENITLAANTTISLNDGSFGGVVKVGNLLTKINNIESKINSIGVWSATVTPPLVIQPLILTTITELENDKVKHGI